MIDEYPVLAITVYLIGVIAWMAGLTAKFGDDDERDAATYSFFAIFWPAFTVLLIACIPFVIGHAIGKRFIHD